MRAGAEAAVGYRTRGFQRRRCCKPGAMIDRAGKGTQGAWYGCVVCRAVAGGGVLCRYVIRKGGCSCLEFPSVSRIRVS